MVLFFSNVVKESRFFVMIFNNFSAKLFFTHFFHCLADRAATMSAESVEAPENSASSSMATNIEQPHRSYRSTVLGRLRERASRFAHLLRRENANNDMPHSRLVNEDTSTVSNNTDGEVWLRIKTSGLQVDYIKKYFQFETNQPGWYSDNFSDSLADANSVNIYNIFSLRSLPGLLWNITAKARI